MPENSGITVSRTGTPARPHQITEEQFLRAAQYWSEVADEGGQVLIYADGTFSVLIGAMGTDPSYRLVIPTFIDSPTEDQHDPSSYAYGP